MYGDKTTYNDISHTIFMFAQHLMEHFNGCIILWNLINLRRRMRTGRENRKFCLIAFASTHPRMLELVTHSWVTLGIHGRPNWQFIWSNKHRTQGTISYLISQVLLLFLFSLEYPSVRFRSYDSLAHILIHKNLFAWFNRNFPCSVCAQSGTPYGVKILLGFISNS